MDPELKKDLQLLEKTLHSSHLSLKNRLLSILHDSIYLKKLHNTYFSTIAIIPNERCGNWYLPTYVQSSYFKSTDGHTNNWSFSTRRLNLHILPIALENNGILIVDSTRRGKLMPDSLSKTIPIWCSIINKILFPQYSFDELLFTPEGTVSNYERERILDILPDCYDDLMKVMHNFNELQKLEITKPLRPIWIYPSNKSVPELDNLKANFLPIILVTVSEKCQDGENKMRGYTYVQGAGDDHELWSNGLTADLFWKEYNSENNGKFNGLINLSENEVIEIAKNVVAEDEFKKLEKDDKDFFWSGNNGRINFTEQLSVCKIEKNLKFNGNYNSNNEFKKIIVLEESFQFNPTEENSVIKKYMLSSDSKKSSKLLRKELIGIIKLIKEVIMNNENNKLLIMCNNGEDLSIGVLLCCLSLFYDEDWNKLNNKENLLRNITKITVRQHLIKIIEKAKVNPSRSTLSAVNNFLMS